MPKVARDVSQLSVVSDFTTPEDKGVSNEVKNNGVFFGGFESPYFVIDKNYVYRVPKPPSPYVFPTPSLRKRKEP